MSPDAGTGWRRYVNEPQALEALLAAHFDSIQRHADGPAGWHWQQIAEIDTRLRVLRATRLAEALRGAA